MMRNHGGFHIITIIILLHLELVEKKEKAKLLHGASSSRLCDLAQATALSEPHSVTLCLP